MLIIKSSKWHRYYYVRTCGDVIGIEDLHLPVHPNISRIVRSVAVMSSSQMTQTAIWIGPRHFISTLHLFHWIQRHPSQEECEIFRQKKMTRSRKRDLLTGLINSLTKSAARLVPCERRRGNLQAAGPLSLEFRLGRS